MPRIDDWFDEKTLLDIAPPDVFVRGASAAEHGSVEILEHDERHLRARVADTVMFEAAFWLSDGRLKWSCTCGEAEVHPCEHLLATAFATWPGEAPQPN
jgi:uncharacterized Zn finger protein